MFTYKHIECGFLFVAFSGSIARYLAHFFVLLLSLLQTLQNKKNEITKNVEEAVVDRGEERSENETRRNAESTSSCAHGVTWFQFLR